MLMYSCAPVMRVTIEKQKEYPPVEQDASVVVYDNPKKIPIEYERLGKIYIMCNHEFSRKFDTTKCDSVAVFREAENQTREMGGNALLVTKYKAPTFFKDYYQLNADAINVLNFSSPPDVLHAKRELRKHEIYGKGTWDLRYSLPYINHFIANPDGEKTVSRMGFLGEMIGVDYYYHNTRYLSLIVGAIMSNEIPAPAATEYWYSEEVVERDFCAALFVGLTNNHRYKFLTLGYGLSYSRNFWRHNYYGGGYDDEGYYKELPPSKEYIDNSLGLMFSAYWVSKSSFNVGVIYRPSLFRLSETPTFKYQHSISVDFSWKIRLKTVAAKR